MSFCCCSILAILVINGVWLCLPVLACEQAPSSARSEKNLASEASGIHSFCSRFKPEIWRKCSKELLKATSNSSSCALHAEAIVDSLSNNYANLQAVVKICQVFISELSTVIDSTNQILIPGAGIMERRQQWNVYRLPCGLPPHQTTLGLFCSPRLHSAISP